MANQRTPTTDAVEGLTAEKIILSGTAFQSAILGPGAYLIAADAAPSFYRDPIISGPFVLGELVAPPLLTCDAQSFTSSPRATITYQWKRDAVNIGGETSITYTTVLADIGTNITCEATITNASGADTGLSNGIDVIARVPSDIFELDIMPLLGMSDPNRTTVNAGDIFIISGLEHTMKIDMTEADQYVLLGIPNDVKVDINELDIYAVSGSACPDKIDVDEASVYGITCFASADKIDIDEGGAYAMWAPINLDNLVVPNGDAELVSMADWTMDIGAVTSVTTAPGVSSSNRGGARFFKADSRGLGVDSQMSLEITIPAGDLTDIDTGRCYAIVYCRHDSQEALDHIEITLEAINATPAVIGTATHVFTSNPINKPWRFDNTQDNPLSIPTLTRVIKIIVLFKANDASGGPDNNGYLDDLVIELLKIE